MAHFYSSMNCFKHDLVSTVHQKSYNVEIKTNENASGELDQDRMDDVSRISSSCTTQKNFSGPTPIQWPRPNCTESHSYVSSKPLIKD